MSEATQQPACQSIPQTEIPHAARLFTDLLYRFEAVAEFYPYPPLELESYRRAAAAINYPAATRAELATVLEEQASRQDAAPQVLANLTRFRAGSFALVTGQQVGLFGGPVFSFYKALTAIKLAATLTASGLDTIPIFWLATEDHDLEEVNHTYLLSGAQEVETLHVETRGAVEHAPVGSMVFGAEIEQVVERALAVLPSGDGAEGIGETAALLRRSYRRGETLGSAFARFLAGLFGRFGLVVMDPMDARLRRLAAPVLRTAIASDAALSQAILARNAKINRAGYHTQVHVADTTSLVFVNVGGERVALRRHGTEFLLHDKPMSHAELLERLDRHPEQFTANALLRPVEQDTLLPTIGYVGGPAELAYFAQVGPIYQQILGRMPVVTPRSSFTLVDRHAAKLLRRYTLDVPAIFHDAAQLRERMALRYAPPGLDETLAGTEMQMHALLTIVRRELDALDHTLDDAAQRATRKMTHQLHRLRDKAARALLRRNEQVGRDASFLMNHLYPRASLQERVFSGVSFLAHYGMPLLDTILENVKPFSADHQALFL